MKFVHCLEATVWYYNRNRYTMMWALLFLAYVASCATLQEGTDAILPKPIGSKANSIFKYDETEENSDAENKHTLSASSENDTSFELNSLLPLKGDLYPALAERKYLAPETPPPTRRPGAPMRFGKR